MGTPTDPIIPPEPVAPGNLCLNCWGSGKPFDGLKTPSKIEVSISGVQKSEDWTSFRGEEMNGVFEVPQTSYSPCEYLLILTNAFIQVIFGSLTVDIIMENESSVVQFIGQSFGPCELFIINSNDTFFVNGTAKLTLPRVSI